MQTFKIAPKKIPSNQWDEVRADLKKSIEMNIIRPSSSLFAFPVVIVCKPSGEMRLCVDYRTLNSQMCKNTYPLPRIEVVLVMKGAQYFWSLYLAHGFHHIPVAPLRYRADSILGGNWRLIRVCL